MNWLIHLFEKAIIRRAAYFIAPFLLGWMSQAWWVQDALSTWGFHPDNLSEFTGEIILFLTAALAAANEYVAWRRNRIKAGQTANFNDLIESLHSSGKLEGVIETVSTGVADAAKKVIEDKQRRDAKQRALNDAAGKLTAVIVLLSSAGAFAQDSLPSPKVNINTNSIVEFVKILPQWDNVDSLKSFFQTAGNAMVFNGVYSASTKTGLSSGGGAITTSFLDLNLEVDPGSFWALHFGPAVVIGEDSKKTGLFTAVEIAMHTDPLGKLMDLARRDAPWFALVPRQVDKMYVFVGAGVETFNLQRAAIVSAGAGYKF